MALTLAIVLAGNAAAPGPAAAQGTQEQQTACTPDVMRLCSSDIPNVPAIVACMKRKRAQLSPQCLAALGSPRVTRSAREHRFRRRHHVAAD